MTGSPTGQKIRDMRIICIIDSNAFYIIDHFVKWISVRFHETDRMKGALRNELFLFATVRPLDTSDV